MVCYCLDLRPDSKLAKFLSNKFVSILAALVQLILWASTLMTFIFQPPQVKQYYQNAPAGTMACAIIFTLVCVVFSTLALVGLFKDKRAYIKWYLVFLIVWIAFIGISLIVQMCTHPSLVGVSGFFGVVFTILLELLTFFIIRNYYLAYISKEQNRNTV